MTTANRAWMPLHIGHYLQDTGHLSALEHGAYLLLIMEYWKEGCLPSDERMIRRIAKLAPDQWADSCDILKAFFHDGWRHKRIDEELAKADTIIAKRRAAGKQRWSKAPSTTIAHAQENEANALTRAGTPVTSNLSNASALDAAEPRDVRKQLWSEGVAILQAITGLTNARAKSLVGKWLKAAGEDCAVVLGKIQAAQLDRVGEPVAWITAAVRSQAPPGMQASIEGLKNGTLDLGDLLNGNHHDRTIDASYERTDRGSAGHTVQGDALPPRR